MSCFIYTFCKYTQHIKPKQRVFLHFSQVKEIIVLLNTRFMSLTRAEMSENNENESWVDMSWIFHDRG